ncbi:MAG: putative toxin-antitoxin system toxin component, PIN family [Armatimonadetes bacterium]|nr:putative toxin-antitoxin system toxin component, PIN family [Armatimonadota bacterium]
MKVVLDTNVVVSGTFFRGVPCEILRACAEKRFQLVLSPDVITEYREVLDRFVPGYPGTDTAIIMAGLTADAVVVDAPPLAKPLCRDPQDDKFIACAVEARADCIVSGDRDLKDLDKPAGIPVLSPRQFLTRLAEAE